MRRRRCSISILAGAKGRRLPTSPPVRVSLVMPTWNAGPLLDEVLGAVKAQQPGFDECIAIDSGSTDGTVERLQRAGFTVTSIPQREFDHGSTRDRGIATSSGDVVVLLTQDATPQGTDWLQRVLAPFADPQVAGVWCRQTPRPGCQPILERRIRGWPGYGEELHLQRLAPGQALEALPPMQQLLLCAFDNVASAVRRTAWERFPLGPRRFGEDIWFGVRVIRAGLALAHQGSAVVMHSHSRTAFAEGRRTFCDHRNLRPLFGLVNFPDLGSLWRGLPLARQEHLAYIEGLALEPAAKAAAMRWTRAYIRWQCWGQYLGTKAAVAKPGWRGWFWRWLGSSLERGIG
jgi:glycosyltransferase involved in cell wall biosynthesis